MPFGRSLRLLPRFRSIHGAQLRRSDPYPLLRRHLLRRPTLDIVPPTSLFYQHARRGQIDEARALFDSMPSKNVVAWNAMLSAYASSGGLNAAREMFDRMPERNVVSWTIMLCALLRAGRIREAEEFFGGMPERNVVSWNAMVAGLARNGELSGAREMFDTMPERNPASWNAMIAAYSNLSLMEEARDLFRQMPPATRNVVTWTTMIAGFARNGDHEEALLLFREMAREARALPNGETLVALLYACTGLELHRLCEQVHAQAIAGGMEGDERLSRCLIQVYARLGAVDWASWIFRRISPSSCNTACWNSMISGYSRVGRLEEARRFFDATPFPDWITATTMLSAYFDAGEVAAARNLFDQMGDKDGVAWTAAISGLVRNELVHEAMEVFSEMMAASVLPLDRTFAALLGAAGSAACLDMGRQLHGLAVRTRPELDTAAGNALVAMYAKCGDAGGAIRAFSGMPEKDVISWNTVIMGLAHHGLAREALQLFDEMPLKPDSITFLGALMACGHAGLLQRGGEIIGAMAAPGPEHYACMAHLLGRAGRAAEAEELLERLPSEPGAVAVWGALLAACGDEAAVAERVAWRVLELDPQNAATRLRLCRLRGGEEMGRKGLRKAAGLSWVVVKGKTHAFLCGDSSHPLNGEMRALLSCGSWLQCDDPPVEENGIKMQSFL